MSYIDGLFLRYAGFRVDYDKHERPKRRKKTLIVHAYGCIEVLHISYKNSELQQENKTLSYKQMMMGTLEAEAMFKPLVFISSFLL